MDKGEAKEGILPPFLVYGGAYVNVINYMYPAWFTSEIFWLGGMWPKEESTRCVYFDFCIFFITSVCICCETMCILLCTALCCIYRHFLTRDSFATFSLNYDLLERN